jgi:hypothetical protein
VGGSDRAGVKRNSGNGAVMNAALVDGIVKAVLYEGYLLYPYRPSAVKNRQRFNFGVVYPRAYSEVQGGTDAWVMQTECLLEGNEKTECLVRVRFLRLVTRSVGKLLAPSSQQPLGNEDQVEMVGRLEVDGKSFQPWQETVEEVIEVTGFHVASLAAQPMQWPFRLSAKKEREALRDKHGLIIGILLRDKASVTGTIELAADLVEPGLFKLTTRILNLSRFEGSVSPDREEALSRSLVSAHTILEVGGGEFVSLIDPPERFRDFARSCQNIGTWPVLVGEANQRDTLLSSPIILYDYPEIAPESPGDLFDGAEIDEILLLRIMTLTEDEKREMRESDVHARQILERTEALPDEHWMKLHGVLRGRRAVKGETP